MTSFSISADQFKDILTDFKNAGVVVTTTVQYDDINRRFFTAPLNACHVKLLQNPLIIGSLPNIELALENPADEQDLSVRSVQINATFEPVNHSSVGKRAAAPDDLYVQTGIGGIYADTCPYHLQDLSDPWAKPLTEGANYGFDGYLFTQSPSDSTTPLTVYILDDGIDINHVEFATGAMAYPRPGVVSQRNFYPGANDNGFDDGHGTCMASYLMGTYSGVAKYARVKSYKITKPDTKNMVPSAMMSAVGGAIQDVISERALGITRNAIINISGEASKVVSTIDPRTGLPFKDPWTDILDKLENNQILLVYAAGNFAENQLQNHTPIKYGGSRKYLIVVGLCNSKGGRHKVQTSEGTSDALSVYAYAHHTVCAQAGTPSTYFLKIGTSGAAAMVSGMLAILLKEGLFSADMAKQQLMDAGRSRKPPIPSPNQPNGVPRVAFPFQVACPGSPTNPQTSRPSFTMVAQIPIPVNIGNNALGDSVNNVLARAQAQNVVVPCQQW